MTTRLVFDRWTLLTDTGELWRGASRRRLPAQALQVLVALLGRPGELVPRDELVARLWPDTVVDYDAGLNAIVRKLRVALEDDAERPRYIETVPRCGYRYVGPKPIDQADNPAATAPPAAPPPAGPRFAARTVGAGLIGLLAIGGWWVWRPGAAAPAAATAASPSTNADAYDAYLKSRLAYRDGDWLGAHALASTAIERDPAFGAAYLARAAAANMAIVFNADASEARLAAMHDDLQRGARLSGKGDPMLIAVDAMYTSIGRRDHERSLARFAEAEAAGLSDPTLLRTRAMQLVVMNRLDDAIAAHRSMAALDPDNFVLVNMTASLLSLARRPDEALRMSRLVLERFPQQAGAAVAHGRTVFAYSGTTGAWRAALDRVAAALRPDQRLQETFDLLRYERRERELLARLPGEADAVVGAGTFNGLTLCCVGKRPVAHYRGWAAILLADVGRAADEGRHVLAFVAAEPPTRWNGWYLELLRGEGLLMAGRRQDALAATRRALSMVDQGNMVQWRYAAAIAARVFAWGNAKDDAIALLEALERARPGLRPAEITHDPFYVVPLDGQPRFVALRDRLRAAPDSAR